MGNQQSAVQFCSGDKLYTRRVETTNYKSNLSRVGYNISAEPKFQVQRINKVHQQRAAPQQQEQEPLEVCKSQDLKRDLLEVGGLGQKVPVNKKKKSFNVYISCLDKEEEPLVTPKPNEEAEIIDHFKDDFEIFEGEFGNIIINKNGLILYTDITGRKHCEEYDREGVEKIFPLGISYGGLTKSIWFKDPVGRDDCFELMTVVYPPSYAAVVANPTKYALPKPPHMDDDDMIKVFEGINDRNVIVHAENIVLFTDINGEKRCTQYNKHSIRKCFPSGICSGGLKKTIWLKDEMERDLCFMLMQWNMDEASDVVIEQASEQRFTGLYGSVRLHSNSEIEFTSLGGDRLRCYYEPSDIFETFPKGISYGRLPKSIWFRDLKERNRCIAAMRKM